MSVVEAACLKKGNFIYRLPSVVMSQLLCYLDTNSLVSLSQVSKKIKKFVTKCFHLSLDLPFTTSFARKIQKNAYIYLKPVLRLKIGHLAPDFIRKNLMLHTLPIQQVPISKQLMLLNLDSLTHICLNLDITENEHTNKYREGFLGMLQSTGALKSLRLLHLVMHQSFLQHFLPENHGRRLMMDGFWADTLVLAVTGVNSSSDDICEGFSNGLRSFIKQVRALKFKLYMCNKQWNEKTTLKFENDFIEYFEIVAPCSFKAEISFSLLKSFVVSTSEITCLKNKHILGKCVIDWRMVRDGCPALETFGGIDLVEFKKIRLKSLRNETTNKTRITKKSKNKRRLRCGNCKGCQKDNCGKCLNCKDMKRFGGKGTRAQACEERKCISMEGLKNKELYESSGDVLTLNVVNAAKLRNCTFR